MKNDPFCVVIGPFWIEVHPFCIVTDRSCIEFDRFCINSDLFWMNIAPLGSVSSRSAWNDVVDIGASFYRGARRREGAVVLGHGDTYAPGSAVASRIARYRRPRGGATQGQSSTLLSSPGIHVCSLRVARLSRLYRQHGRRGFANIKHPTSNRKRRPSAQSQRSSGLVRRTPRVSIFQSNCPSPTVARPR